MWSHKRDCASLGGARNDLPPSCNCGFAEALALEVKLEGELREEMRQDDEIARFRVAADELRRAGWKVEEPS